MTKKTQFDEAGPGRPRTKGQNSSILLR